MNQLRVQGVSINGHEPLHQRVPTRDEDGRPLSDFMMLIPGLRDYPRVRVADLVNNLQATLGQFSEVVFVDLNVTRNMLWVSVRAVPGIIPVVAGAIQVKVPEALVVGAHGESR